MKGFYLLLVAVGALRGHGRPVRRRAGQVLGDARPAVHQPPVGPDGEEPALVVPRLRSGPRARPRQVRRLYGRPALRRAARGERTGRRGARRAGHAELLRERASVYGARHLGRFQGPRRQPDQEAQVIRRQAIVLLALVGLLVATYLWLYKRGAPGELQCGTGSCEYVQASRYAELFGIPVAFYGVAGYAAPMGLRLATLRPRFAPGRPANPVHEAIANAGFMFPLDHSAREPVGLFQDCRWCVVSAVIMTAIWVLSITQRRRPWSPMP